MSGSDDGGTKRLLDSMRGTLEADEAEGKLAGLTVDDLADAMSHPKAGAVVAELMGLEPESVQQGQPAPDFSLPWLPGSAGNAAATMTLSDHFGDRPVALIFGSYT
jgi:hypothetical protein